MEFIRNTKRINLKNGYIYPDFNSKLITIRPIFSPPSSDGGLFKSRFVRGPSSVR